jgi:hypothetical protein
MDVFTKNLINYVHWANLKNIGHCLSAQAPAPILTLTPTLAATGEPMDFNRILDTERKYYFDNRLYFTYGLPGYWKDTYDPTMTANPVPMPVCQMT